MCHVKQELINYKITYLHVFLDPANKNICKKMQVKNYLKVLLNIFVISLTIKNMY